MATYTTNYNLEKPDASDPFGDFRQSYNDNLDIIDANLGGGGGSSSLAGLSDVDLTTPTDGQVLTYDGNSSKWVNANGGGGDTVSWTQIQASGTKIAEIDINGTSQDVYAPSGGGGGGIDYTLTEQVVGTWLGKPLYQITIPFSGINLSANTYYGINISSDVTDYETMFLMKDMSYYMVNNVERLFTEMTLEPPTVYIKANVARTNISGHFVVRYTKTTD